MSDQRALRITTLRERIDRAQYHVDVDAVAEAILGRPIARMLIIPAAALAVEADADGDPSERSEDVLEAA